MALCAYHETTEATSVCVSCKQDICAKCREYGANGMCGMCLEMANARNADIEASRVARLEANAANAAPRRPAGAPTGRPAPAGAPGARGPARTPTGGGARTPTGGAGRAPGAAAPKAPPKAPPPPGMCPEHHDKKATAACNHCKKKVCPYCLDLYDHCGECRQLPACVRHESMVAASRCSACKMHFCSICLDGTDRCDRCRTLGLTGDAPESGNKATTQKLKQPSPAGARGTTRLQPGPDGQPAPARSPSGPRPAPTGAPTAPGGPRPNKPSHVVKRSPGAYVAPQARKGPPWAVIGGGVALLVLAAVLLGRGGGSKPAYSPEEAARYLKEDMAYVQNAAIAYKTQRGMYPDNEAAIFDAIKSIGVNTEKLPMPIKLVVNAPADEPLEISFRQVGTGFEVRAVDLEGRPFTDYGREVVLRSPEEAHAPSKHSDEEPPPEPAEGQ